MNESLPAAGSPPRTRVRSWLPALLVSLLGAGPAAAQEDIASWLEGADLDGNGRIERSEAPIALLPEFDRFDLNEDDALDRFERYDVLQALSRERAKEAAQGRHQQPERPAPEKAGDPEPERRRVTTAVDLQRALDRNGDGVATLHEIPRSRIDLLLSLDQDGDRQVTVEEARAIDEGRARRSGALTPPAGRRSLAQTVGLMDTDGDGRLQRKEAPRALQQVFRRFDRNGDGAIDAQEAAQADAEAR